MEHPKKLLLLRCRLCTRSKDIKCTNIFENRIATGNINLLTKIYECTSILITQTDHLSSLVCRKCYRKINEIYKFRQSCLQTQQWFNEQLTNIKSEPITDNQHTVIDPLAVLKIKLKQEQPESAATQSNNLDERLISASEGCEAGIFNDTNEIKGEQPESEASQSNNLDATPGTSEGEDFNDSDEVYKKITVKVKKERKKRLKDEEPKLNESVEHDQEEKRRKIYKKKLHPCDVCGKMIEKCRLQQHINEHLGVQPYACEVEGCGKLFYSNYLKNRHIKDVHNATLGYACGVCGKLYALQKSMYNHQEKHKEPRYICQVCGRRYKTNTRLKTHMRTHTGERPYPCPECPKMFAKSYNLKTHLRIHTKEKPFACSQCGASYAYRQLLKAHVEKCHVDNRAVLSQICTGEVQH